MHPKSSLSHSPTRSPQFLGPLERRFLLCCFSSRKRGGTRCDPQNWTPATPARLTNWAHRALEVRPKAINEEAFHYSARLDTVKQYIKQNYSEHISLGQAAMAKSRRLSETPRLLPRQKR